jgi:flagellar protein FliO/FliZ
MNSVPGTRARLDRVLAAVLCGVLCGVPLAVQAATDEQVRQASAAARGAGPASGAAAAPLAGSLTGSAVPSLGFGAIAQTVLGLAVVIGLVFACAWVARRLGLQPSRTAGLVRVVGGASLGQKERIAVVEIGDTWVVVGAAPGNVRALHVMPAGSGSGSGRVDSSARGGFGRDTPAAPESGSAPTPSQSFGDTLRDALAHRFIRHFPNVFGHRPASVATATRRTESQ